MSVCNELLDCFNIRNLFKIIGENGCRSQLLWLVRLQHYPLQARAAEPSCKFNRIEDSTDLNEMTFERRSIRGVAFRYMCGSVINFLAAYMHLKFVGWLARKLYDF